MTYRHARIKTTAEQILIYPFILLGQLIGFLFPLKNKSRHFLFFPSDAIGGATKVNIDILHLLARQNPTIFFSKKYSNHGFAKQFRLPDISIIDLRNRVDNKWLYFINVLYRGMLSTWINRSQAKVVFGGESLYFYKVIPYLNKSVKVVELCHLPTWLNYSQAFVKHIDQRITSTPKLKRNIEQQYKANGVPQRYLERIVFIDNWVDIPELIEHQHQSLNILFVGRGAPQKRVHIISQIAEQIYQTDADIRFTFVGDVMPLLSDVVKQRSKIYEYVEDKNVLYALYDESDILILTSAYEGLPIVVMDMMVRGKVVLSTAVDGIPDYIEHKKTGLLIHELDKEGLIVEQGVRLIMEMNSDKALLREIGQNAYRFARERFLKEHFEKRYQEVFALDI